MFIREDFQWREMRGDSMRQFPDACHYANPSEFRVWSAISNRHTSWSFRPLCLSNERGHIVKGSRVRCPFITRPGI